MKTAQVKERQRQRAMRTAVSHMRRWPTRRYYKRVKALGLKRYL